MGEKIMIFLSGMAGLVLIWILLSWINIVLHNTTDFCYAWWNLFLLLCH